MKWVFCESIIQANTLPTSPGLYAVTVCWSEATPLSQGVTEWTGSGWRDTSLPILAWAGPFDTAAAAEDWAYKHDMDA